MTQEHKQLLSIDLCARLPYGVKCYEADVEYTFDVIGTTRNNKEFVFSDGYERKLEQIKPYLRPMSSMTEDEREEWTNLFNSELDKLISIEDEKQAEELAPNYFAASHSASVDWLNKKMFDYRELIPMGLALKAPEGMYKNG